MCHSHTNLSRKAAWYVPVVIFVRRPKVLTKTVRGGFTIMYSSAGERFQVIPVFEVSWLVRTTVVRFVFTSQKNGSSRRLLEHVLLQREGGPHFGNLKSVSSHIQYFTCDRVCPTHASRTCTYVANTPRTVRPDAPLPTNFMKVFAPDPFSKHWKLSASWRCWGALNQHKEKRANNE